MFAGRATSRPSASSPPPAPVRENSRGKVRGSSLVTGPGGEQVGRDPLGPAGQPAPGRSRLTGGAGLGPPRMPGDRSPQPSRRTPEMTSNDTAASATPPPAKQAAMTGLPARGGTAPGTPGTGPAPRRRRGGGAAPAMLAVPLAATAPPPIPAAAATRPYADAAPPPVGYNPDPGAGDPAPPTRHLA